MKILILSAIIAYVISALWAPNVLVYSLVGIGFIYSTMVLVSLKAIKTPLVEKNDLIEKFCSILNKDIKISILIREIYGVYTLQILNIIFLRENIILLFLSVGLILLSKKLIDYLEENYLSEFEKIMKFLEEQEEE